MYLPIHAGISKRAPAQKKNILIEGCPGATESDNGYYHTMLIPSPKGVVIIFFYFD